MSAVTRIVLNCSQRLEEGKPLVNILAQQIVLQVAAAMFWSIIEFFFSCYCQRFGQVFLPCLNYHNEASHSCLVGVLHIGASRFQSLYNPRKSGSQHRHSGRSSITPMKDEYDASTPFISSCQIVPSIIPHTKKSNIHR